jgi:hypothetical protein
VFHVSIIQSSLCFASNVISLPCLIFKISVGEVTEGGTILSHHEFFNANPIYETKGLGAWGEGGVELTMCNIHVSTG